MSSQPHLYLIDGSGYIFRAYHALPPMSRKDGTPVNAVYGFSNMLFKLLKDVNEGEAPTHFAVIFDAARKSFRNDLYADYKAHRPDAPEDLVPQFSLIREATKAFNVAGLERSNYEADDLIATFTQQARAKNWRVTIVSSDKDLMQLVDDGVDLFDSMKNRRIGLDEVHEKFGVTPDKVIDVQALCGDSADNVPGVPGIGPKIAAQLITEYGDLESLLDRAAEIKQTKRRENLIEFADQARLSKKLVTLMPDVPLDDLSLDDFAVKAPDVAQLLTFIDENGFRSLRARVVSHLGDGRDGTSPLEAETTAITQTHYETVDDLADLERWITRIKKAGRVAVDTETTGILPMHARLVGISLSVEAGAACYIPLRHRAADGLDFGNQNLKQIPVDQALKALKPILEDPAILKIGQNIKYDMVILANEGIHISPHDDTMLLSYVRDCGLHGHGMDELSRLHLGIETTPFKDVAGSGKKQVTFDLVPIDKATHYAAEDADITGRLWRLIKPMLPQAGLLQVYESIERPLVPVIAAMERAGIKVDRAELARLSAEFAASMERLEKDIHALAGESFNIGSPKQLGEILFDKMGLQSGKKGKSGALSTGVEVLETLAAQGHDLPEKVLAWRQVSKLKSTYTDALAKAINEKTGRVHTSFSMASTSTGRLSSNDPNLQNIPIRTAEGRKIRKAFIAEDGHVLLAADYSQIELRILAHMADIDALKTAFAKGVDIHALTASQVFDVPLDQMDSATRRRAKAINFGIIYGISAFGLARQLGIGRDEAKGLIDAYFKRFPGILTYMEETRKKAHETGHVTTLFGRRSHVMDINAKNPNQRAFAERAAINAPIQGTAADIIKRAMIAMPKALADAGLEDVRMLLQVHDELIFELPQDRIEAAQPVIRHVMENACAPVVDLSVPLIVEIGTGANWGEAH
ncbi:DNA polymerase I [alpha proteobacterium Q-1]|nr:DNA polymerase I [alpha proteobacterium Q-1]